MIKTSFYREPKKQNVYLIEKHNFNCKGISFVKTVPATHV